MQEKLSNFMSNPVNENIILSSILVYICSQPVRIDLLDGKFKSTTSPFDTTHENLTYLHMLLFEVPLTTKSIDGFSLMKTLKDVYKFVEEFTHDRKIAQLVKMAQENGNLSNLTIPKL